MSRWMARANTMPWTPLHDTNAPNRVYVRPLGTNELGFFWDRKFNGTADNVEHAVVEILPKSNLFSEGNVSRAWKELKQTFPLLGCQILDSQGDVQFQVSESQLREVGIGELNFGRVTSPDEWQDVVDVFFNEEKHKTETYPLPFQIVILQRNNSDVYDVLFLATHCITDGTSNFTIMRNFFDALAGPPLEFVRDLEESLGMAISSEELSRSIKRTVAAQRWRRAIAAVIFNIQISKFQGGHTLPMSFSSSSAHTPTKSFRKYSLFSPVLSSAVIENCRKRGITFGNALPVLGQIALTRVLLKRYLRGEISKDEWEFRKREPMHVGGPFNLRPYLEKQWFDRGGGGEVCLAINYYNYTLPFMPLGAASTLEPQIGSSVAVLPFSRLLSLKRFNLRCKIVKSQAIKLLQSPLILELAEAASFERIGWSKNTALQYQAFQSRTDDKSEHLSAMDLALQGFIYMHGGASIGNVDLFLPDDYPLLSSNPLSLRSDIPHPAKGGFSSKRVVPTLASLMYPLHTLHILSHTTHLHCRPGELYLGASTFRRQLRLGVFWDGIAYEEATVNEWVDEVENATEFYLGDRNEGKL